MGIWVIRRDRLDIYSKISWESYCYLECAIRFRASIYTDQDPAALDCPGRILNYEEVVIDTPYYPVAYASKEALLYCTEAVSTKNNHIVFTLVYIVCKRLVVLSFQRLTNQCHAGIAASCPGSIKVGVCYYLKPFGNQ